MTNYCFQSVCGFYRKLSYLGGGGVGPSKAIVEIIITDATMTVVNSQTFYI